MIDLINSFGSLYFSCSCIHFISPFNSQEALDKAKRNVEETYAVVGILEDLNTTFAVMEHYVPRFFKGIENIYHGLFQSLFGPTFFLSKNSC